jgi:hypothetical protein
MKPISGALSTSLLQHFLRTTTITCGIDVKWNNDIDMADDSME